MASDPSPTSSTTARVEFQVGERRFTTLASTIPENSLLGSIISGRWESCRSNDGSYFIDADPELFAHILRYLRRLVLPIFYSQTDGFNHSLYDALQAEAEYFGVDGLSDWIKDRGYLKAVTNWYDVEEVKGEGVVGLRYNAAVDGDTERSYHPSWRTEKVYQCPRNIVVHHGYPNRCGRDCYKTKGDAEDAYAEKDVLRTLIVTKRVAFNDVGRGSD